MKKAIIIIILSLIAGGVFCQDNDVTQLFFIRHAEKVKDGSDDPMLTERGEARAENWAQIFQNVDFDAIYSTQTIRTLSTALPTAVESKLEITPYNANEIDIIKLAKKHKGQVILVVGHSNTTPRLVNLLIEEKRYGEIETNNNSNLYIVNFSSTGCTVSLLTINL